MTGRYRVVLSSGNYAVCSYTRHIKYFNLLQPTPFHAVSEVEAPMLLLLVSKKDRLTSVAEENDVVESTGEMNTREIYVPCRQHGRIG
jgi:hypothetical protein